MDTSGLYRRALLLLAMVAFAALPVEAQQKSTLDAVKARGTLVAGVKNDYPPFGSIDEGGKTVGFDIDIVEYIANRLGVKLDLRPVTSANRIPMLMNETVDLIAASTTITQERGEVVDFSVPISSLAASSLFAWTTRSRATAALPARPVPTRRARHEARRSKPSNPPPSI